MIVWLADLLSDWVSWFRLFHYITFRAVMAALTALFICLFFGPWTIRRLTELKIGQAIRKDGPQTHLVKAGTPTMGGSLIIASIVLTILLWANLTNIYIWLLLFVLLSIGGLGFYDDWKKVVYQDPNGVSARFKIIYQSMIAIFVGIYLLNFADYGQYAELIIPFIKNCQYPLGALGFCVLTYFVIVGTSNAVNLTDGLDGLVALPVVLLSAGLSVFTYVTGHIEFSNYLQIIYIPEVGEVTIFCAAICGACLGFLWWNAHPAQVFMGDVGSLALGGVLGTIAVIVRQEIILFIMGGLFVVETLSVMLQVGSYKMRRKRVFLMAPIHHHYEQKGWEETQVVIRSWIITIVLILIGLTSLKIR
ncbi:MAG: phospho-N-acetylmuramoyl-pentapeptide-transferase [Neisseriaceae bacterium]|nr:MAG: phospho-N-acetylmuramoyl-pentapeptide-transferase [Neisseriaceae bacterium]